MKRIISCLLFIVAPCILFAQDVSFTITGHLENVKTTEVHISCWGQSGYKTYSAKVTDNNYVLKFPASPNAAAILQCGSINSYPTSTTSVSVYLGPDNFSITHSGAFTNVSFTGSPENIEYHELYELNRAYGKKSDAISKQIKDEQMLLHKTNAGLQQELMGRQMNRNEAIYAAYMRNHPTSRIMVFLFNQYAGAVSKIDAEKIQPLFDLLPDSIKSKPSAQAYQQRIYNSTTFEKGVAVGKQAPDFSQADTSGKMISLSSFKGSYVLLDFWASWCGPCRAENPAVVKAYNRFHEKGFEILSVSLDQPGAKEKWLKAIHTDQLTWTHVSDLQYWDNAAVKLYGVQGVPQNFLIDPQGKIIARSLRGADLEKKLSEIYQ